MSLLSVADLEVTEPGGRVLVDRLTLAVAPGQVVGLVGEPGSGAVEAGLALLDTPGDLQVQGEIRVGDDELLVLEPQKRRRVRGARVGALFPDPREAFDPGLTLYENMVEVIVHGAQRDPSRARELLIEELTDAGVPTPSITLYRRAGQLPSGILQRACVALAAACGSQVVVAESIAASLTILDAADVHELLRRLADERDVGVLLITEDIAEAAAIADEIILMYAGEIHEQGSGNDLLTRPLGPYTRGLLASVPRLDRPERGRRSMPGASPRDARDVRGCRFAPRCAFVENVCTHQRPDVRRVGALSTRCHFADEASWPQRMDAFHGGAP